jgi:hypothetical protein
MKAARNFQQRTESDGKMITNDEGYKGHCYSLFHGTITEFANRDQRKLEVVQWDIRYGLEMCSNFPADTEGGK